ncbi:MAG: hypothetical protein ABIG68_06535 [Acidobacteriota bacterium]
MPKKFYTEKDIEDLFKMGIMSLEVNDNVVLTELAYEKSKSLGMHLKRDKPDNPPSAPVRPYVAQKPPPSSSIPPAVPGEIPMVSPAGSIAAGKPGEIDLPQRIRSAVIARLGSQVDPNLLDVIIRRVLNSTGAK